MTKHYIIAGHRLSITLEEPWTFKPLSSEQTTLVEKLHRGEDVGIIPVPADKVQDLGVNSEKMGKQSMTREEWDGLSSEERFLYRHTLDLLQYAPFETGSDGEEFMSITVSSEEPGGLKEVEEKGLWTRVVAVDEILPFYYGYRYKDRTIYEFFPSEGFSAGLFVLNEDQRSGTYYPRQRAGSKTTLMQLNTSLMILYTFATAPLGTVLLHASVTRYEGKAALFFGISGTGKSTHSRLWLQYVPGCDVMNDDNPVIRIQEDGSIKVYGSPWSGKTLCYRNVEAPVRALVRLEQSPVNEISRINGLEAYASVIAAVSTIRWNSSVMDRIIPTVEKLALGVPCFNLRCRPDEEAVMVCKGAVTATL